MYALFLFLKQLLFLEIRIREKSNLPAILLHRNNYCKVL